MDYFWPRRIIRARLKYLLLGINLVCFCLYFQVALFVQLLIYYRREFDFEDDICEKYKK